LKPTSVFTLAFGLLTVYTSQEFEGFSGGLCLYF